jgi:hypothetical protein
VIEAPLHFMLLMFLALFILGAVMGFIIGEARGYYRAQDYVRVRRQALGEDE